MELVRKESHAKAQRRKVIVIGDGVDARRAKCAVRLVTKPKFALYYCDENAGY